MAAATVSRPQGAHVRRQIGKAMTAASGPIVLGVREHPTDDQQNTGQADDQPYGQHDHRHPEPKPQDHQNEAECNRCGMHDEALQACD
jgi:hypothetical protein